MRHPNVIAATLLLTGLLLPSAGTADDDQDKKDKKAAADKDLAVDPAQAGPDFAVQGEYAGTSGAAKLGAQVIALGDGVFKAALLPGGLPGDGYTGSGRKELDGKRGDAGTVFSGAGGSGTISGDRFTGTDAAGQAFTLTKVLRQSPTLGAKPPAGAVVLFDGGSTEAWNNGKKDERGNLMAGAETKRNFTSYQLHVEFLLPFKPFGKGQDRGNSGVYVHHTYEFQVLDSFGLEPEKNLTGSLYTVVAPKLNMCFPPLSWQTYDIDFTGPAFDAAGKKSANARVTVRLNGVVVQDDLEIERGTGANKNRAETPQGGPLWLQDHGNPVAFRNVWLVEKK
jgi:hypothetical protein